MATTLQEQLECRQKRNGYRRDQKEEGEIESPDLSSEAELSTRGDIIIHVNWQTKNNSNIDDDDQHISDSRYNNTG